MANEQTSLLSSSGEHNHGEEHSHSHSHGHSYHDDVKIQNEHDRTTKNKTNDPVLRRLKIATALCTTFLLVEVVGGYVAGSLAVLSDAAHLMADLASFGVAIIASYLAARPSTPQHTYGLKRTESLAALFSMVTLALLSVVLALEAIRRIYFMTVGMDDGNDVDGKLMSGIATIGVLVNLALAAVLGEHHTHLPGGDHGGHDHSHDHGHHHDDDEEEGHLTKMHSNEVLPDDCHNDTPSKQQPTRNVNLHAAYLHVMADLAQSVAVLIAGLIIWWKPDWKIVDPIATILFCILVFYSTLGVIRSAICVLLEEVPPHISWQEIHEGITSVDNVEEVHDLHVWSISHGINAMSVHVRLGSNKEGEDSGQTVNLVMSKIASIARSNGISHSTIQVQPAGDAAGCITCAMADESQSCVNFGDC